LKPNFKEGTPSVRKINRKNLAEVTDHVILIGLLIFLNNLQLKRSERSNYQIDTFVYYIRKKKKQRDT